MANFKALKNKKYIQQGKRKYQVEKLSLGLENNTITIPLKC